MASPLTERASKLFEAKKHELRESRSVQAGALNADFNGRSMFHSGNRLAALQDLYVRSLRDAAAGAWQVLQDAHIAMGSEVSDHVRSSFKTWMGDCIRALRATLGAEFAAELRGMEARGIDVSLSRAADVEFGRYDALVDNYLDMVKNQPKAGGSIIINAQTIGAVVTGEHAVAHVKQNPDAVKALTAALEILKDVIPAAAELNDRAKGELMEMAGDAERELRKAEPNETKLLAFFTILAQTVQTLPAAKPAYDTIKGVLAAFGVNLP